VSVYAIILLNMSGNTVVKIPSRSYSKSVIVSLEIRQMVCGNLRDVVDLLILRQNFYLFVYQYLYYRICRSISL